jgi:hypothetical protein
MIDSGLIHDLIGLVLADDITDPMPFNWQESLNPQVRDLVGLLEWTHCVCLEFCVWFGFVWLC